MEGVKDEAGKLFYEIDWDFVEGIAKRMAANKGKYEPFNWTKKLDTNKLNQALIRHFIEIQKGNFQDEGDPYGHYYAIVCNIMMTIFQLKKLSIMNESEVNLKDLLENLSKEEILKVFRKYIDMYPNDQTLGQAIRELFSNIKD